MKLERLNTLLFEYGRVALGTYLGIFFVVFAGFLAAIAAGAQVQSVAGGAGVFGAAWLATKATQPLRIAGTVALTPVVARLLKQKPREAAGRELD